MKLRDVIPRRNFLEGKKIKIDDILDKELTFTNWDIRKSKFGNGNCLILQFKTDKGIYIVNTGSNCLIEDLKLFEEKQGKVPFEATIVKINKAYVFK